MFKHFKTWNIWRKEWSAFDKWYKIRVLFGLTKSGTLEMIKDELEEGVDVEKPKKQIDWWYVIIPIVCALLVSLFLAGLIGTVLEYVLGYSERANNSAVVETVNTDAAMVAEASIKSIPEPEKEFEYFDVPLEEDLQNHIFKVCEERGVDPAIVVAIIEKESVYDASVVGDSGRSYGLMQIQPRWHYGRMESLGCTDLLDPYQNVTVGVDYLAELLASGNSLEWVLMAYNGGSSYANRKAESGQVSDYVYRVLEIKEG